LRRKAAEAPTDVDASPNAAITCPHKALLPETSAGAKRQVVSEEVWQYFLQIASQIHGNEDSGCISFPVGTATCSICDAEITVAASQQENLRSTFFHPYQNVLNVKFVLKFPLHEKHHLM
jgi:hypothetical protein